MFRSHPHRPYSARNLPRAIALLCLLAGCTLWLNAQETGSEAETTPEPAATESTATDTPDTAANGSGGETDDDSASQGGTVTLLQLQGAIGPATADFITRGIEAAEDANAVLFVLEMDTPGGLDTSMRDIIQAILGSTVPVATFVSPQGARAASAGTYILYASHIAAMAPATNLGAATPVAIGAPSPATPEDSDSDEEQSQDTGESSDAAADSGEDGADEENNGDAEGGEEADGAEEADGETESADEDEAIDPSDLIPGPATATERKAINDAVAYIRSLAELRDRNADWAEAAVRAAESLSSQEALEMNVIDVIADDLSDLLEQLDGGEVEINGRDIELDTTGLIYERIEPDWRTRLLEVISNPTVAYMLMLLGIYGLLFEGYNPGAIVPGVVGAISLLLALFSFQILPINYAGLALIALGVILMVSEFLVPSFGALGMGGIAAFVFGSVILIDSDVPGFSVSLPLIITIAASGALVLLGIVWFAVRSRDRPVVSGEEEMLGARGEALHDFDTRGQIWVHGERWTARTSAPVTLGQTLEVVRVEGLTLHVVPRDSK